MNRWNLDQGDRDSTKHGWLQVCLLWTTQIMLTRLHLKMPFPGVHP
jgi:hypothetical protein